MFALWAAGDDVAQRLNQTGLVAYFAEQGQVLLPMLDLLETSGKPVDANAKAA